MNRRSKAKTVIEETFVDGLSGHKFKSATIKSGLVQLSTFELQMIDSECEAVADNAKFGFDWQRYTELQSDHGEAAICQVLHPLGLYILTKQKRLALLAAIESKISIEAWQRFQKFLFTENNRKREEHDSDVLIVAAWVELFEEPFQEVWLAAMAWHAYVIQEDDYAVGYLIALLDQKKNSEADFLRGKQILQSASHGGVTKSHATKPETNRTLAEMSRLISDGHTLARASELACRNGFGSSVTANKKLWNRNRKK